MWMLTLVLSALVTVGGESVPMQFTYDVPGLESRDACEVTAEEIHADLREEFDELHVSELVCRELML